MKNISVLIAIIILLSSAALAQDNKISPISNIWDNTTKSITGTNSLYHLAGIASSAAIIYSGTDIGAHNYFAENSWFETASMPAVFMGYLMPLALGGGLAWSADFDSKNPDYVAACAVLQSAGISFLYGTLLKAITGRPNPDKIVYDDNRAAEKFRPGFMEGGIHYGWPSGHLMVNTAIATTLISFYPENDYLLYGGIAYIAYMMLGVTAHEQNTMHWLSDVVCGTLMGYVIGKTVGKDFRSRIGKGGGNEAEALMIRPTINGLAISIPL